MSEINIAGSIDYFLPRYTIGVDGSVWSKKTRRYLSPCKERCGYLSVLLSRNGKSKRILLHRLVAYVHIKNKEDKPQINHKNGDKTDNRISNLEWVSVRENFDHAKNNNLTLKGSKNNKSKITSDDVLKIRAMALVNKNTHREIASIFGITRGHCSKITRCASWSHI